MDHPALRLGGERGLRFPRGPVQEPAGEVGMVGRDHGPVRGDVVEQDHARAVGERFEGAHGAFHLVEERSLRFRRQDGGVAPVDGDARGDRCHRDRQRAGRERDTNRQDRACRKLREGGRRASGRGLKPGARTPGSACLRVEAHEDGEQDHVLQPALGRVEQGLALHEPSRERARDEGRQRLVAGRRGAHDPQRGGGRQPPEERVGRETGDPLRDGLLDDHVVGVVVDPGLLVGRLAVAARADEVVVRPPAEERTLGEGLRPGPPVGDPSAQGVADALDARDAL